MRTQIALEPAQHAQAKQKAARLGITMAEYIRRLVDRDLGSVAPQADPSTIIAIGRSGGSDVATDGKIGIATAVAQHAASRQ